MAPRETAEELARRLEHEQRASNRQRESNLDQSLAPFRVGSVRYLNATGSVTGAEMAVWGAMGALLFCSVTVRAIFRNRRDGRSQVSD